MSLLLVQLSGLPTVVTLHELVELTDLKTLNAPGGRLAIFGARLLTHIVARADVVCLTLQRYVNWFSIQKPNLACVYIPIGAYNHPECLPDSLSPELLFFSTLAPYKGLEVLISAYLALLPGHPDLRLTIAGTEHPRFPGYGESMRNKYAHLNGVRWLGQVPEDQIRSLFERAQLVILPYLASTGSSSVILQAGMWARAIVASDIPELRLLIDENGLEVNFFTNRDPNSLAEAIQSLIISPARRKAQIEHNFNALQRLRPEATCRLYLQAFNLALEARQSSKRLNIPTQFPSELA
jgi:glycosyltransferase involved in cell wall biosynthesis